MFVLVRADSRNKASRINLIYYFPFTRLLPIAFISAPGRRSTKLPKRRLPTSHSYPIRSLPGARDNFVSDHGRNLHCQTTASGTLVPSTSCRTQWWMSSPAFRCSRPRLIWLISVDRSPLQLLASLHLSSSRLRRLHLRPTTRPGFPPVNPHPQPLSSGALQDSNTVMTGATFLVSINLNFPNLMARTTPWRPLRAVLPGPKDRQQWPCLAGNLPSHRWGARLVLPLRAAVGTAGSGHVQGALSWSIRSSHTR